MSSLVTGAMVTPTVRLVRQLGAGGMGSVWLADHLALQAPVVVKFMSGALASSPDYVARFSREAAAASQVRSPHVVQMLDHGVTQEGIPYIVMEFLEGHDLGQHLAKRGRLSLNEISPIVVQVCKALTQAHKRGIVHRDIKPENIFLCDQGEEFFVKLLDFGIARSNEASGSTATATGTVMGSPPYMSPEQLLGSKTIDHRTDLWAVGIVVYEALTGRRPFDADTVGALAVAVHTAEFPLPSRLVPTLPPALDQWFFRACARKQEERFSSAKEMVDALLSVDGAAAPATMRLVQAESAVDPLGETTNNLPDLGSIGLKPGVTTPAGNPGSYTAPGIGPKVHGKVASDPTLVAGSPAAQLQMGSLMDGRGGVASVLDAPNPASGAVTQPRGVQTSSPATYSVPSEIIAPPKKSKAPLIVALLLGVVLVGGGGFFAYMRFGGGGDADKKTATTTKDTQTTEATTSAAPTPTESAPAPKLKTAKVKVVLPPGAILKVGPNDWTSKVAKDGTIELSGPENASFRLAIYQGKKQLVSQTHVLFDDNVVDPAEIDPGKGEQFTMKPMPTATKPVTTGAPALPTAATATAKPTTPGTATEPAATGKKPPKVDEKPE